MVRALIILNETIQLLVGYIVMRGDSDTVLKFVAGDKNVKKVELSALVWEVLELVKEVRGIRVLF